jgi:hypothetical protein
MSPAQLAFKILLEMQGIHYHLIRTMREFFEIIAEIDHQFASPQSGDATVLKSP